MAKYLVHVFLKISNFIESKCIMQHIKIFSEYKKMHYFNAINATKQNLNKILFCKLNQHYPLYVRLSSCEILNNRY